MKITHQALRNCPICEGIIVESLHTQNFESPIGHPINTCYEIVCCCSCGFVYADVKTNQIALDNYYSKLSKYEDINISTGSGITHTDKLRFKRIANFISGENSKKNIRILDIGCANGGLLREIKDIGYTDILGLDLSEKCVETTKRYANCDAYVGSLSSFPENIGKFDCIILSHVLEHIYDLNSLNNLLNSLLNPKGMVYIEVPDGLRYSETVVSPFQEFNTEHINHFSTLSLKNLLNEKGFTSVIESNYSILVGDGTSYPVLNCVFRRTKNKSLISYDVKLRESIQDYIRKSQELLKEMDHKIKNIIKMNPQIIIWGTGQLTIKLLAETSLRNANIIDFIDGNTSNQGKMIFGKEIHSPEILMEYKNKEYPILISTLLHQKEIINNLHQMGLNNKILTLE